MENFEDHTFLPLQAFIVLTIRKTCSALALSGEHGFLKQAISIGIVFYLSGRHQVLFIHHTDNQLPETGGNRHIKFVYFHIFFYTIFKI